ncbi:MAG: hypothetical protein ACREP5_01625 [Candidatus Binatia bacterium]
MIRLAAPGDNTIGALCVEHGVSELWRADRYRAVVHPALTVNVCEIHRIHLSIANAWRWRGRRSRYQPILACEKRLDEMRAEALKEP